MEKSRKEPAGKALVGRRMSTLAGIDKARTSVFGQTYELTMTRNYVSRWGVIEAIRELIQNALDSSSPFFYEFRPDGDGAMQLVLRSEFSTLTPQTLLLGATSKAESSDSIGSFGEGYKLALLVLLRSGHDVRLLNGDLVWTPRFRFSKKFAEELLVIDETVAADRFNKGLTVVVSGLDESQVAAVRGSCLRMQQSIGEVKSTSFGEILLEQKGRLYVGSLFVCETALHFGYNVKPEHIRLERDRQTVADFDLKWLTAQMWYATEEIDRVVKMIADEVPDLSMAQYNAPAIVRDECYRFFREKYPGAIIARNPEDLKNKIEAGMTRTVYLGSSMYSIVSSSRGYLSERPFLEKPKVAPHVALAAFLSAHRSEMRTKAIVAMKALIKEAEAEWIRK